MMLMSRQLPRTEVSPSPPSFLDSSPYTPVPFLNHRATLLALMISFMVFSWICCLLRLYTRFVILRVPGWDDVFIILTMLSTAVGSIVLCILPDLGLGRSIYTMNTFEFERFMRIFYIGNAMYPVAVTVIKLALLFQYLRVFEVGSRTRVFCKFMIALTTVWGLTFIALRWVPCYPVAAYWKPSIQGARCWGFNSQDPRAFMRLFVSQATSTAVLDLIVFAIPIQLCFRHDTPRNTKLCLLGLLVLGSMSISCAIGRMVFVIQRFTADDFRADPSWYGATTAGLACLEVHLAAACAALPVFWPVLKTTWGRIDVTTEVSVTREFGRFHPKTHANTDVELHSASSTRNLTLDSHEPEVPGTWEPFVGNETTGVGENTTVVEAPAAGKKG